MNREELSELAAGYALGSLDGADRERFDALLRAGDAEARSVLQEYQQTVVALAGELQEVPPPAVKAALMGRIAAEHPARPRAVAPAPPPARRRPSAWTVVSAAAMAAGIAAIAVGLAVSTGYERRVRELDQQASALRQELARQQATMAILRDPTTQIVALAGQAPSPEARARVVWHAANGGIFVSAGLPPPPPGKAYQLWAIAGKNAPVPAGVFTVDARGTGTLQVPPLPGVSRVDVFAVTLEPAGGVPAPTGPMYLLGKS